MIPVKLKYETQYIKTFKRMHFFILLNLKRSISKEATNQLVIDPISSVPACEIFQTDGNQTELDGEQKLTSQHNASRHHGLITVSDAFCNRANSKALFTTTASHVRSPSLTLPPRLMESQPTCFCLLTPLSLARAHTAAAALQGSAKRWSPGCVNAAGKAM